MNIVVNESFTYSSVRVMDNCIFCKVISWQLPSYCIYQDDDVYCFLDINPANKGHILIVPKTHVATIFDAEDQILASIIRATKKMALIVKKALWVEDINIVQANWELAGQEIWHLHFHVMPWVKDDDVTFSYKINALAKESLQDTHTILTNHHD